jgi:penicillin G amidase
LPVAFWWIAQRALPVMDGVVNITDLYRQVTVTFDDRAVPYVQASTDTDAYFAQGYVTAAQRLFQMDMLRRTAKGELSEVFGSGCLKHDKLMRTVGFNRLANDNLKKLPREVKEGLQAYTRGVNAFISDRKGRLSLPYTLLAFTPRPWQETDSLAILKYAQYQADESWQLDDLRQRILDKIPKLAPQIFGTVATSSASHDDTSELPSTTNNGTTTKVASATNNNITSEVPSATHVPSSFPSANTWNTLSEKIAQAFIGGSVQNSLPIWGSNAWVIAPSMSESKGALLACDKHSLFSSPDIWFLCALNGPKLHIAGATVPGVPGVFYGRNDDVAWSATAFKVDGQDLVLEQFSPQFPERYKTPTGWSTVTEVNEDIQVRFNKALVHKVLITKDGPILSKTEDTAVALAWASAQEKPTVLESYWKLNRASSAQDILKVLESYSGAPQSFVYADKKGAAGFHVAGNIPLHGGQTGQGLPNLGSYGTTATPGWTVERLWPSRLDFSQLPAATGAAGFAIADPPFTLSTANNFRFNRINALLASVKSKGEKVGLPDMAYLQADQYGSLSNLVKKEIQKATTHEEIIDKFQLEAASQLDKWDGNLKPESAAASIYESFLHTLARRLLEPKLGLATTLEYMERWPRWTVFVEQILTNKPKDWLPPEERTYETFIITTFAEAVKNLRLASKSDDPGRWAWQNLHRGTFRDEMLDNVPFFDSVLSPLYRVTPVGLGGDADCVNACNVVDQPDPWLFPANTGPTGRLLIDLSDPDKFYANITLGQSEHLLSPYRIDQLHSWLKAEPLAVAFSPAQAEKQMQHKLILANQ